MIAIKSKRVFILGFFILIIIAAAIGGYFYLNRDKKNETPGNTTDEYANLCVDDEVGHSIIINQADLTREDTADLKPIVDQILELDNHDKSAACLYATTLYYANIADEVNARTNLDKLIVVFDRTGSYGKGLDGFAYSIDEMKVFVDAAEAKAQNFKDNVFTVPTGLPETE